MRIRDRAFEDTPTGRRDTPKAPLGRRIADGLGARAATEPTPASRPVKRLWAWWGNILVFGILFAAAIGLIGVASRATRTHDRPGPDELAGGGLIVRNELLHLWLPEVIIEWAREGPRAPAVADHRDLKQLLELRHQQGLWYAMTVRQYLVNGDSVDVTFIRRPYHDTEHFSEVLAVLATAGGDSSRDPDPAFSTASIHIIPDELAKREPRVAIAELLGRPLMPAAPGRAR